ncbi:hypothetical protein pdam_00019671 [Pocillopora damicornis]|uniref:Uncharacterized protein n=1 Tax=Pocillopora damicornis TaxID=46731 RepID=A0A3M6UMR0_POCDA|nr:hypothetical protein pdam_00019671 [Pocillopora damicornis]
MDVHGNDKRWLVTLVTSNKVVAPVLQDVVKQGMDKLYATLDNYLNGLPTPCSLQTLTYADVCHLAATPSPASSLKDLNFGNINNNSGVHGKTKTAYNHNVNSLVDLAKLYLPYYLAEFSAFDKSMDLNAALRLLGCRKYPVQVFVSSDPLHDIQPLADDVRDNVRNRGSHFKESDWTQIFFDQCFDKLKALLQYLPLLPAKKKELLDQLSAWKTEGTRVEFNHSTNRLLIWQFSRSDVNSREMEIRLKRAETGFSGITGHSFQRLENIK